MPQKFVNLENLTSFWGNAKEYIGNERQEIEDQLYNWQKTEKAPVVQCEPVPNSELHPTVEFKFKETLPEGEKGPENPSVITGVNSISVSKAGKNIIAFPYTELSSFTRAGITYTTASDGSITVNGTATDRSAFYVIGQSRKKRYHAGDIITVSGTPTNAPDNCRLLFERSRLDNSYIGNYAVTSNNLFYTFTAQDEGFFTVSLVVNSGVTVSNVVFKPQVEFNSVATSFETYNGADYVLNLNDTYYGGSIDLSTGLMTVTIGATVLDETYNFGQTSSYLTETSDSYALVFYPGNAPYSTGYNIPSTFKCDKFPIYYNTPSGRCLTVISNSRGIKLFLLKTDLELGDGQGINVVRPAFLQWLQSNPVLLTVSLEIPEIIQLTPQQIKSLPSLEGTSKRINTIYTDADSVQVEYQKYVGIDSTLNNDSVNAIQNKVVNSALNTKVSLSGDETINGTKTFSNTINGSITGDAGTVAGHIVSKDVPVNAAFTDTTYNPATQSTAGLMSASDKVKLDAVGSVFSFKGSVIDDTYLPASDNVNGDAYLAEDTGHVHVYDGSSFVDIGVWAGIPSATDAQIDALFED